MWLCCALCFRQPKMTRYHRFTDPLCADVCILVCRGLQQARLSSLEGCTVSNRGQRPRIAGNSLSISLEGCTPAKMAAGAAAPKAHSILPQHGCAVRGAKVTPRCGTEERFSSFALRLFVSLTLRLFVFLSLSLFVSLLKFI